MPIGQPLFYPTLDTIMQLVRSIVRDTFTGVGGQQGRIFTNDAPFTLPLLNSALRWMYRQLRNAGTTFPIRDGVVIFNLGPQANQDTATFVSLTFDGYFNGETMDATKRLPGDCFQPLVLRQRTAGSNFNFQVMSQAQEGLISAIPQQNLGQWEWRNYALWMNGSLQAVDVMLRYIAGQAPFSTLPDDFSTTVIHVQDCEEAVAFKMASIYALRNNADPQVMTSCDTQAQAAIEEMALAYVRRAQTVNYRRIPYGGGGSGDPSGGFVLGEGEGGL